MKVPALLITICLIAGLVAGGMPQLGLVVWLYEEISKGYYQQGKRLYKQHRLKEAEIFLKKAIDLCPFAPLPIHYLALVPLHRDFDQLECALAYAMPTQLSARLHAHARLLSA